MHRQCRSCICAHAHSENRNSEGVVANERFSDSYAYIRHIDNNVVVFSDLYRFVRQAFWRSIGIRLNQGIVSME